MHGKVQIYYDISIIRLVPRIQDIFSQFHANLLQSKQRITEDVYIRVRGEDKSLFGIKEDKLLDLNNTFYIYATQAAIRH